MRAGCNDRERPSLSYGRRSACVGAPSPTSRSSHIDSSASACSQSFFPACRNSSLSLVPATARDNDSAPYIRASNSSAFSRPLTPASSISASDPAKPDNSFSSALRYGSPSRATSGAALNRLLQTMGWPGVMKLTSRWFSFSNYGAAMGVISLSYLFGDAAARRFMGRLIGHGIGWRGVFFAAAGVMLIIFISTFCCSKNCRTRSARPSRKLPEEPLSPRRQRRCVDLSGRPDFI
jgi:Major Facilitator Superfamily